MKTILLILIGIKIFGMSLEESLRANSYQVKESKIKNYDKRHYEKKKGKLIIRNKTNSEVMIRLIENLTKKKRVDIFINKYSDIEEFKIPIGSYNIVYYHGKNFIDFDKIFEENHQKIEAKYMLEFKETVTFKHLCKGIFEEDFNLNVGEHKYTNVSKHTSRNLTGQGVCRKAFEIILSNR